MERPTFADVLEARKTIAPYVPKTPLHPYPALAELLGAAEVRIKHENHHALGAFKVRGGVNLLAHMSPEERRLGVTTPSSGNHGQSIAYGCRLFGARAVICLPENANPLKVASMRRLGAEIVFHGSQYDEAKAHCEMLAKEEGYRYIHASNTKELIAGVGTAAVEIMEDFPEVEVLIYPFGGGSGVSGGAIVAKTINPNIRLIAVQSAQAPAGYLSWKSGRIEEAPMESIAEGLATSSAYELTQEIVGELLDDFLLVDDSEILHAIGVLLEKAHTLAETAGAAATAGALKYKDELKGKKVAIMVSGGNITLDQLQRVLEVHQQTAAPS